MAEKPELDEWVGIGITQINFAQHLESPRRHLLGVRHEAVDDLEAVNIGVVLLDAAEAVEDGRAEEAEDGEQKQQRGQ